MNKLLLMFSIGSILWFFFGYTSIWLLYWIFSEKENEKTIENMAKKIAQLRQQNEILSSIYKVKKWNKK